MVEISDEELRPYTTSPGLAGKTHALLMQQKATWPMLRENYLALDAVTSRQFDVGGILMKVQFNPKRITSTAAKTDPASIKQRRCFLCIANLPAEQRGFLFRESYMVLCNPFPILTEHFTIPHVRHTDQVIVPTLPAMLDLAREYEGQYTVFYNGPKCGASAPDHLHLQAGTRGFMPLETEYQTLKREKGETLFDADGLSVTAVSQRPRPFLALESSEAKTLSDGFIRFVEAYAEQSAPGEEPMMNVLCWYDLGKWTLLILPRSKHRPACYFAEGPEKIVVSPAAVDLAGVLTTPIEADYLRMNETLLWQIIDEVMLPEERFTRLKLDVQGLLGNYSR